MYNVDEVFEILKKNKITSHKESVRRWLRQGVIRGISPSTRKEGWQIPKESVESFLSERLPDVIKTDIAIENAETNETYVVKEAKERARVEMWYEVTNKNIWEGYIEIKRTQLRECISHRRYSKELEQSVWEACVANSKAYSKPRVSYLLEAFKFDGKRLLFDQSFAEKEEQVIFAIIEYVRASRKQVN